MIKSKLFIAFIIIEFLAIFAMIGHGQVRYYFEYQKSLIAKRGLVSELGLTDFAIWTEARYTRHPSQADFFSAFQEFPGSFEHFPAGAIMAPPQLNQGDVK